MLAPIWDLQNKVNSLSDARDFYDLESGSSSGSTHVPDQTSTILSFQDIATLRFWIATKYTELYGYYGKRFLNDHLFKKDYLLHLPQFPEFGIFLSGIGT